MSQMMVKRTFLRRVKERCKKKPSPHSLQTRGTANLVVRLRQTHAPSLSVVSFYDNFNPILGLQETFNEK